MLLLAHDTVQVGERQVVDVLDGLRVVDALAEIVAQGRAEDAARASPVFVALQQRQDDLLRLALDHMVTDGKAECSTVRKRSR